MSTAATQRCFIAVDDYLRGEPVSPVKHEYLGGNVYAMAVVRNAHGIIQMNVSTAFMNRLRGKPCRRFRCPKPLRVKG